MGDLNQNKTNSKKSLFSIFQNQKSLFINGKTILIFMNHILKSS